MEGEGEEGEGEDLIIADMTEKSMVKEGTTLMVGSN